MIFTAIPYCPKHKIYTHDISYNKELYIQGGRNKQAQSVELLDKDLSFAYNELMERMNDDDWVCFIDHDAMFTTKTWYKQIEKIIENLDSNVGALTCLTNRLSKSGKYQWASFYYEDIIKKLMKKFKFKLSKNWVLDYQNIHDIKFHRELGHLIQKENMHTTKTYPTKFWKTKNIKGVDKYNSLDVSMSGVVILISKKIWKEIKFPPGSKESGGLLGVDNWFHKELAKNKYYVQIMTGIYVYHWYDNNENLTKFNSLIDC